MPLNEGKEIPPRDLDELRQYFSKAEEEAIQKEQDYMLRGPGRLETILNEEMGRLSEHMNSKIK